MFFCHFIKNKAKFLPPISKTRQNHEKDYQDLRTVDF